MDVDSPVSLKRSSSAPMINVNELNTTMTTASTSSTSKDSNSFNVFSGQTRVRRFSASFSPVHTSSINVSPVPLRLTPRVNQLRQEECLDIVGREAAHERELHSAMQLSQSWEDLTLMENNGSSGERKNSSPGSSSLATQRGIMDPLHLNLPAYPLSSTSPLCSSPSPTRSGLTKQCFSPGLHAAFKSNLSPSPTRKAFATRRSQSPIAMRPSSLGPVKRKFELEDTSVAKRPCYTNMLGDRGGLLMAQPSRLESTSSPLPGSLSSVGTPESLSSADSPGGFSFRPVDSPTPPTSTTVIAPNNPTGGVPITTHINAPMDQDAKTSEDTS